MRNQLGAALAPQVTRFAEAVLQLASSGGIVHRAFHALLDNLGRLGSYAATFTAFLAGRWVAGMAAAALSGQGIAIALLVLRGGMVRTGIWALIVGTGELIYQFNNFLEKCRRAASVLGNGTLADPGSFVWHAAGDLATLGGVTKGRHEGQPQAESRSFGCFQRQPCLPSLIESNSCGRTLFSSCPMTTRLGRFPPMVRA
jgi:hypothetical protein